MGVGNRRSAPTVIARYRPRPVQQSIPSHPPLYRCHRAPRWAKNPATATQPERQLRLSFFRNSATRLHQKPAVFCDTSTHLPFKSMKNSRLKDARDEHLYNRFFSFTPNGETSIADCCAFRYWSPVDLSCSSSNPWHRLHCPPPLPCYVDVSSPSTLCTLTPLSRSAHARAEKIESRAD